MFISTSFGKAEAKNKQKTAYFDELLLPYCNKLVPQSCFQKHGWTLHLFFNMTKHR